MDKYTKFILTIIAIGVLGLNFHLIKGEIVSPVNAANNSVQKVVLCNSSGFNCAGITPNGYFKIQIKSN
jgi:hypothetical protein|tara:strand:- start:70 stop:276 length:207 start_codon:yes stop_codon:yes gene_type:complete